MKTLCLMVCFASFIWSAVGLPASGSEAPGRADPAAPVVPGDYHLAWDDDFAGQETVIHVGSAADNHNLAVVTTKNREGLFMVMYPAIAFYDMKGVMHVDCRGAPMSQPHDDGYTPDSFAISKDGTVKILNDNERWCRAMVLTSPPGALGL